MCFEICGSKTHTCTQCSYLGLIWYYIPPLHTNQAALLWYILETTLEDRQNGLVFLSFTGHGSSEQATCSSSSTASFPSQSGNPSYNFDRMSSSSSGSSFPAASHSFDDILPLRFSSIHYCLEEGSGGILPKLPNFDYVFRKESQSLIKINSGPRCDILDSLENEALPREILPVTMGGHVDLDPKAWVHERLAKEYAATLVKRIDRNKKGNASICVTNETPEVYGDYTYVPKPAVGALHVEPSALCQKSGRKPDLRMNRATLAKLRNPLLSRRDALMIGGFVYPEGKAVSGKPPSKILDAEGISLYQRMNHLNRRVKLVREKHGAPAPETKPAQKNVAKTKRSKK